MKDEVIILGDPSGDIRGREIFWPLIMSSRLKVACWNVQGLKPWKVNDNDFLNHLKGNDIKGFHFYLKPRRSNAGKNISLGGIAVLMRSDLRKSKGV